MTQSFTNGSLTLAYRTLREGQVVQIELMIDAFQALCTTLEYASSDGIRDWHGFVELRKRMAGELGPAPVDLNDRRPMRIELSYDEIRYTLISLINGGGQPECRVMHQELKKGFWEIDKVVNEERIGNYLADYLTWGEPCNKVNVKGGTKASPLPAWDDSANCIHRGSAAELQSRQRGEVYRPCGLQGRRVAS